MLRCGQAGFTCGLSPHRDKGGHAIAAVEIKVMCPQAKEHTLRPTASQERLQRHAVLLTLYLRLEDKVLLA
jgi:hypothetical protein